jgi:hypothetical protein
MCPSSGGKLLEKLVAPNICETFRCSQDKMQSRCHIYTGAMNYKDSLEERWVIMVKHVFYKIFYCILLYTKYL